MLRHLRRRARLTQRELGIAVGYSEAYITRLEGDSRLPSPVMVRAVFVDALGLRDEPQLAAQLIALAEAARDTRRLTSSDAAPRGTSLPAQLTRFIGRANELADLGRLQRDHRLVTVTGAGGVGKTRLALEAAAAVSDDFGDGVRYVELAPLSDAALVAQTVAAAVGMPNQPALELVEVLCAHLADKHMLLLLDNCEHLIEACAALAETLLRSSLRLCILATSREALRIPGEVTWRVPPMHTADAVQLFADRAVAVRPDFALTETNAKTVAAIGAQLDGIPLAIELAASRLAGLSLDQLASRLGERLRLLTSGSRTALPRHRTLRALTDWSHDLLSEKERILFRRLSVFVGGWTAEAAERVCGEPRTLSSADVLPLLLSLASKSLVAVDASGPEARFRLHETIREYGLEHLAASDEVDIFRRRHAEYFLDFVRENAPQVMRETGSAVQFVLGVDTEAWLEKLVLDQGNLRAALQWALGEGHDTEMGAHLAHWLYEYWNIHGQRAEAIDWLERALSRAPESLDALLRVRLLYSLSDFASHIGDIAKAEATCSSALSMCREHGFRFDLMRALQMRAGYLQQLALFDDEQTAIEEWRDIAHELHDARHEGIALNWLGLVAMYKRNFDKSAALHEESLRVIPINEAGARATAEFGQALNWMFQGDRARALTALEHALSYFRGTGWGFGCATVLNGMGTACLLEGDRDRAAQCFRESLALFHRYGTIARVPWPLDGLAVLAAMEHQGTRATILWTAAQAFRTAFKTRELVMNRARYTALIESAQADLPPATLAAAEAAGRALTVDQAVAYALAE